MKSQEGGGVEGLHAQTKHTSFAIKPVIVNRPFDRYNMFMEKIKRTNILIISIIVCLLLGSFVYAAPQDDEITSTADVSDRVLQAGGIPEADVLTALTEETDGDVSADASAEMFKASTALDRAAVFSALTKAASGWNGESSIKVNVSGYGVTPDNVKSIYTSFMNVHGEFFFVSPQFSYGWKESEPTKVTSITMKMLSGATVARKKTFDNKVKEIMSFIDMSWSDIEKALFIHDYLVTHCGYDEGDESTYHYDAYSCLIDGSCVCQGYSLSFDYLCGLAGVDSYVITSKALGHAWNMIGTGGEYYHIDCTFDDPMKSNKDLYPGYCGHEFFMLSYDKLRNNKHFSSDWLIDSFSSAAGYGTSTAYDSGAFWTGTIARIIPVSSHKWCYIGKNSTKIMTYNFSTGKTGTFATLSDSFYNASLTYDGSGGIYASTGKHIYKINSDGTTSLLFTNTDSRGDIYGIDASWPYLIYYIYKNDTVYVTEGKIGIADHWEKRGGKWYCVDENGECYTGFKTIEGKMYFFDETGAMAEGWKSIDGEWYYFESSGAMKTGWFKSGSTWYYFDDKGVMATGVTAVGSKVYFFSESGAMKTGWQQADGKWYYLKSGGEAAVGWQKISKVWYYFDTDGRMATGWRDIGTSRYFFKQNGKMATGWLLYEGNYYYLASGGAMKTGWMKSGKKWYYMEDNGIMLASCSKVIGSKEYSFDSSGACINP